MRLLIALVACSLVGSVAFAARSKVDPAHLELARKLKNPGQGIRIEVGLTLSDGRSATITPGRVTYRRTWQARGADHSALSFHGTDGSRGWQHTAVGVKSKKGTSLIGGPGRTTLSIPVDQNPELDHVTLDMLRGR